MTVLLKMSSSLSLSSASSSTLSAALREYEAKVYDPDPKKRDAELRAIASSGCTLIGRNGIRDKCFLLDTIAGLDITPREHARPAAVRLPAPWELNAFKTFWKYEEDQKRGASTGEHQIQGSTRIIPMLIDLVKNDNEKLRALTRELRTLDQPQDVLRRLTTIPRVGCFTSWQVLGDLIMVTKEPSSSSTAQRLLPAHILNLDMCRRTKTEFALFGTGACRGANIIARGTTDADCNFKPRDGMFDHTFKAQTGPRSLVLKTAQDIVKSFKDVMDELGLREQWEAHRCGREMDLETVEHHLCGLFGRYVPMLGKAANPSANVSSKHAASTSEKGAEWRPSPSTEVEWRDLVGSGRLGECATFYPDGYVHVCKEALG